MRVPLVSGPYQARSLIASAQRSINLFPESNEGDPQAPVPTTTYPTPGLNYFSKSTVNKGVRQTYRSTAGKLYSVIGPNVYYIDNGGVRTLLGTIADKLTTCFFSDNGLVIVLVDGSVNGYAIDMSDNSFGNIIDPSFYGADYVAYFDSYFVFNRPNTNQFYISLSFVTFALLTTGTSFDPLDIAAKAGGADNIVGIVQCQPYLMLIGELTSEPWYNVGAADFTFARVPGTFIQHGCTAQYSITSQDVYVFWLSQDIQGKCIVIKSEGSAATRISTHAIEVDFSSYQNVTDAIGFCYQQQGHSFYCLCFPTDSKTWCYELATGQWHERAWIDANGNLLRHRMNCCTFAYNKVVVGDWQNGDIYILDTDAYTDVGNPILCIRTFPHMLNDGNRAVYNKFIVDIQTGTITDDTIPLLTLKWSDDRGVTYNDGITKSMGKAGDYISQVSFWRLGMARDRVFELSWSAPVRTALNGAFVDITPNRT